MIMTTLGVQSAHNVACDGAHPFGAANAATFGSPRTPLGHCTR